MCSFTSSAMGQTTSRVYCWKLSHLLDIKFILGLFLRNSYYPNGNITFTPRQLQMFCQAMFRSIQDIPQLFKPSYPYFILYLFHLCIEDLIYVVLSMLVWSCMHLSMLGSSMFISQIFCNLIRLSTINIEGLLSFIKYIL